MNQAALGQLPARRVARVQDLRADAALEEHGARFLEQHERPAAGVGQRDRSKEDLVGERGEVELPAQRESQIVERLELEQARLQLELRVADEARETVGSHQGPEEKSEHRTVLEGLLARDAEEPQEPVDLPFRGERHPEVALAHERDGGQRIRNLAGIHAAGELGAASHPGVAFLEVDRRILRPRGDQSGLGDA